MRRAALLYAAGRFWAAGQLFDYSINGLELLLVAFLVSSVLGIWLFSRQRRALAEALDAQRKAKAEQVAARRARLDDDRDEG
jgi:membrane protein implicated in regulation of membrane protease activity